MFQNKKPTLFKLSSSAKSIKPSIILLTVKNAKHISTSWKQTIEPKVVNQLFPFIAKLPYGQLLYGKNACGKAVYLVKTKLTVKTQNL